MLAGINPMELMQFSEKIQGFIPQIKKFIPQLVEAQKTQSQKHKLKGKQFFLYSAMLNNSGKIFLYGFKCDIAENDFTVNQIQFKKGALLVLDQTFKIELTQYLDVIEQQGLLGFLQTLPMDSISNFIK